ncbi:MAG: PRC-barrel domain-containing protein [Anditalea sp.]
MTSRLLSSSSLSGTNIRNLKGENIGEIKDLMIDWKNGTVAYAVLSFGGFLGLGEKLFAIPLEAFNFNEHHGIDAHVVLDIDKERLENAPGFDKNNMPNHADNTFLDTIYKHYGYGSYNKYL